MNNPFRSLIQARRSPLWLHVMVEHHDQIPIDDQTPFRALDVVPHRIWRYEAWRNFSVDLYGHPWRLSLREADKPRYNIPLKLYNRIYPALQIATLCLDRASLFLQLLASAPLLGNPWRFDPSWVPTANEQYWSFPSQPELLARSYRIVRIAPQKNFKACGLTSEFHNLDFDRNADYYTVPERPVFCAVNEEQLWEIESDAWLDKNEMQKQVVLLRLAIILVHELAHAVYRHRRISLTLMWPSMPTTEPLVYPETFAELGHSSCYFLFGCKIHYGAPRVMWVWNKEKGMHEEIRYLVVDGSRGLIASIDTSPGVNRPEIASHYVALESVSAFFKPHTWRLKQQVLYLFPARNGNAWLPWPYDDLIGPDSDEEADIY